MATVRDGNKSVLLVVDVQKVVVTSAFERDSVIKNVGIMIQKAREKIVPIVWVQHSDDAIKYKSDDWEIAPELSIDKGDYRIDKHYNSSFEETDLEKVLKTVVATQIVLVGAATNWCIRATAYGALDRGYDVTLISDAHTTKSLQLPTGKTINAEDVITDLNVALS